MTGSFRQFPAIWGARLRRSQSVIQHFCCTQTAQLLTFLDPPCVASYRPFLPERCFRPVPRPLCPSVPSKVGLKRGRVALMSRGRRGRPSFPRALGVTQHPDVVVRERVSRCLDSLLAHFHQSHKDFVRNRPHVLVDGVLAAPDGCMTFLQQRCACVCARACGWV